MNSANLTGLYCITDPDLARQSPISIEQMVEQALLGGARIIQYRDKQASPAEQHSTAHHLCQLCKQYGALFLINDDPELASQVDAHGVHLGQTDENLANARKILGKDKIIGITCHDNLDLALTAQQQGADYVAFGRFFPSNTKPKASPAPAALLPTARKTLHIPIVAIGGITASNSAELLSAGADMLAVIHAVFGQEDIRQAAGEFKNLFKE
ncbi:MAG: thiamine phosphate synthase [Gammaproteobacteria bacterium]|nr:thiamine phosphate synthase [Gammaproteobacteria bacterium]